MDYQEYVLSSNSKNTNILMDDTSQTVQTINSLLNFLTSFITILFIAITLLLKDFVSTIAIAVCFLFFYSTLIVFTKNKLFNNGKIAKKARTKSFKILNESLGGFRDVLLDKSQSLYISKFRNSNNKYKTAQTYSLFLTGFPKLVLEALGISCIAFYGLYISITSSNVNDILTQVAFTAFAAAKILPMFQNLYSSYAQINLG